MGVFTTKKFVMIVILAGYILKLTGSSMISSGAIVAPPKPCKGVVTDRNFSSGTFKPNKASQVRTSTVLPLSINTLFTLKSVILPVITRASSWGYTTPIRSSSLNVMS
ncbi:hypothetical protein Adt_29454 [Abeliophyllum distichum]|uniref:Uncharacterized protein n=1 Tax=Abeliophyllum distichum TaxID=126358 RepID=A0ABD1R8E6_9LAMI